MTTNFRLPGPTPLPPAVAQALGRPMIPHRGPEFRSLYRSILERLKIAHRTEGDVFVWPASGSAGWEAAIVNLLSPGDIVLAVITGDFGVRFANVGDAFGLDVRRLEIEWGRAATPDVMRAALEANPGVRAVFVTHNETSTAVTNPIEALAGVAREFDALVLVDAVSSAGGIPILMDEWDLDFVLSGSQKAWMCPPGLMISAVGPRAWDACERSAFPRFFWDFKSNRAFANDGMTPTTPPLSLLFALDAALDLIFEEGIEQVWERHKALGERTRSGIREIGLSLFADPAYASDTVTAVALPEGISAKRVIAEMNERFDIVIQGGQGHLADQMVRIGHMGWVSADELDAVVASLDDVANVLGIERQRKERPGIG